MLYSKLTNCSSGSDITVVLDRINCRLLKLSNNLYANTVYMMNTPIPASDVIDMLIYKRILTYKQVNPNYCSLDSCAEVMGDVVQWNDLNLVNRGDQNAWWYRIIKNNISANTTFPDLIPARAMIATINVNNLTSHAFQLVINLSDGSNLLDEYIDSFGFLTLTLDKPVSSLMGIVVSSTAWNSANINLSLTIEKPF